MQEKERTPGVMGRNSEGEWIAMFEGAEVLIKALSFILIIVMGYVLKRKGFFKPEDFYLISKIVIRITLPCAIISNFSNFTMEKSLLLLFFLGIGCNLIMVGIGYLMNLKKGGEQQAFDMINLSGYNIGNFTLPFIQNFLGPAGFAATSLFDAGNAVMNTGVTYTLAVMAKGEQEKMSLKKAMKDLLSSIPFDAYMIMLILAWFQIPVPGLVVSFAATVGGANTFLALLMIGIGFEIRMEKAKVRRMLRLMAVRYGTAFLFALAGFALLPFSLEVRQAMVFVAFGPISSVAVAFTGRVDGDVELSSAVNSLSIIISIVMITAVLTILL